MKIIIRLSFITMCLWPGKTLASERDPFLSMGETGFFPSHYLNYQFKKTPEHLDGSPIITEQGEDARFTVMKSSRSSFSVGEKFSQFDLSAPVVIPETGLSVPQTLYSLEVNGSYGQRLANGKSLGLNASVGSDSDRMFQTIHETVFRTAAFVRLPKGPNRAWLFFLVYSNNIHFFNNIPLPGLAYYFHAPAQHIRAVVGFPFFSLKYTPTPKWEARFGMFGPRRLSTEIAYTLKGPVQTYGRFEWGQQEWLRAGRGKNDDRLFFERKRLLWGIKSPIGPRLFVDTSLGKEFDRKFFENDSSSTKDVPWAEVPASWSYEVRLSWKFKNK